MRNVMNKARVILLVLILLAAALVGGCDSKKSSTETEKEGTSAADKDSKGNGFLKEAGSEYELYKTVVKFLNNGFHYNDLSKVYDRMLVFALDMKISLARDEGRYFEGLTFSETYELFTKLKQIAVGMKAPADDKEATDMDYTAFYKALPSTVSDKVKEDLDSYEFTHFIYQYFFRADKEYFDAMEGKNPFGSSQSEWTVLPKDEYSAELVKIPEKMDPNGELPPIYTYTFEDYVEDNVRHRCGYHYTVIDGKYYFLEFTHRRSAVK